MNSADTLQIIAALKSVGATHFKSQDFEISLGPSAQIEPQAIPSPVAGPAQPQPSPPVETVENKEATEKLRGLIDTLKLNGNDLMDKLFPAGPDPIDFEG